MEIRSSADQARPTYHLTGRFDAHQVPRFKEALAHHDAAKGLELDLSGVSFIDSTGLATLVGLYKEASAAGGDMSITGVQDQVYVIFEITHLHQVLPLKRA